MNASTAAAIATTSFIFVTACDRKTAVTAPTASMAEPDVQTKTLETMRLGDAIDAFDRAPTAEHRADVKTAMAELDGEIAELDARVAKTAGDDRAEAAVKRKNLESYRIKQAARFSAMETKSAVGIEPAPDARTGAEKAKDATVHVGAELEAGAKKAGNAIEETAQKIGDTIKDATK